MIKITCNKQELVEAVTNIQRAVSTKSSVPALEGILMKARGESLFLCGYDLELGMTTEIPAQVEESGEIILSAKLFGDIVRRLPTDHVRMVADNKNMTTITAGASEFSIVGIPAEEFPDLPKITDEISVTLENSVLKSMIHQTLFAVAESDAKPIHTGTLFEIEKDVVRLVSVDGYRLAMREEPAKSETEITFVVPGKTLSEVYKLMGDEEKQAVLQVGRRHISFGIGNYTVISRLLEGEFLDYKAAIPASHTSEAVVKTRAFIDSVERVSLLITDRLKSPIRCYFDKTDVKLSCSTAIGRANDEFEETLTGEPVEMGFNNRYLLDALRNAETDEVKVQLNGPLSPMKIVPKEGNSFLFLVLPVRLKQG